MEADAVVVVPAAEVTATEGYPALDREEVTAEVKAKEVSADWRAEAPKEEGAVTVAATLRVRVVVEVGWRARMRPVYTVAPVLARVIPLTLTLQEGQFAVAPTNREV